LVIRRARPEDAPALALLGAKTFADTFGGDCTPEDLSAFLSLTYGEALQLREVEDPDVLVLAADEDGALTAFAQLRTGTAPPCVGDPRALELWRFYVDRPWHGRGIAQVLMTEVLHAARARGASALWLGVWERNARAQSFYQKAGFARIGEHPFTLGSDVQRDWIMLRTLEPHA